MNGLMKFSMICMLMALACDNCLCYAASVPKNDVCSGCETVVETIKYYAEQNYTKQEIKVVVEEACSMLGPGYSQICTFVSDYGVDMVLKLLAKMEPHEVCVKIWMCSEKLDNGKCSLCKFVVDQIMNYVESGHTEEEVKKFITMLCNKAGTKYAPVCTNLLDMGWDELIQYLKTLTAGELCEYITLC